MISKLILTEHKVATALVSAVIVVGVGFGIWGVTSILPYPADAIPAPQLGHFTFCSIPMWLQTQDRTVRWLGDCMGELYSPAAEMKMGRGTVFAIGCLAGRCSGQVLLSSTAVTVVAAQGEHNGAYYFKAVGIGTATIWAAFPTIGNCSLLPDGTQPDRCPAIKLAVHASS
ncbi:MAG: hypothetical protein WBU92_07305 [Candidatus Dormiibacterota bacterium]